MRQLTAPQTLPVLEQLLLVKNDPLDHQRKRSTPDSTTEKPDRKQADRGGLERLLRYGLRAPFSQNRLSPGWRYFSSAEVR